jgi:hypothetical protein
MQFRDIDFGPTDAKGDPRLADYFLKTAAYHAVKDGRASFVIGRKGTGKTAIVEIIQQNSTNFHDQFSIVLSFKNAPTVHLYDSRDPGFHAPNQFVSIWKFLIALEGAKLLLKDQSINSDDKSQLEDFLRSNFGNLDVASLDAVQTLKEKSWKVGLSMPVKGLPSGEIGRSTRDLSTTEIHFGRAATTLLEKLKSIHSDHSYYIFFDELDEDYSLGKQYFDLLISLFKAVYQVRQEFSMALRLHPVILLREDIFVRLDDHDLNKMDDYLVRLRWTSDPHRQTQFSLRRLINERIRANLGLKHFTDLWGSFVDEENWGGKPAKTAWAFLANRTMDRPRDIIKSIKSCQPFEKEAKLTVEAIDLSALPYSEWFANELANEMHRELPEYRQAFGILTRIGRGTFTIDQWRGEFGKEPLLRKKYDPDQVLELLFKFGAIGMVKQNRWLFRYKMPQVTFDIGAKFIVHYGLLKYLVILGPRPLRRKR